MGCLSSKSVEVKLPLPRKTQPQTRPTPTPPPQTPPPPPAPRENTGDFASDAVDIKYDDRKDEKPVPVQVKNDPPPCAIDTNNNNDICKVENHFFDDDNFNLSSDDADVRVSDNVKDDVSLHNEDIAAVVNALVPKPAGKQVPKVSFTAVDEHARKAIDSHADSFESLQAYLTGPISGENTQLLTARAIVVWLSQQNIDSKDFGEPNLTSPRGLLQCLKLKKMTYSTCYVILCRSAGLSCTYINGTVKAAGYEPGDTDAPTSPWTAVYAEGAWRIVHPFWVCRALFGHSLAGWVKVEQDGKSTTQRTQASKGVSRNAFQEYYFMPKPEHFIHDCFPDDRRWQLLPKNMMVQSKEDFFKMPNLFPPFFGLGLQLTSEQSCHIVTMDGMCKIQMKANPSNGHLIVLGYELFVKEADNFDQKNIKRMVFNSRSNEHFTFDIRFPVKGIFKLVIYGGPFKSPLLRLCEFKITCEKTTPNMSLLPLSCGNMGWGPGPASVEAGLMLPSRPNGQIAVPNKAPRRSDITFAIKKSFMSTSQYEAILYDGSDDADESTFTSCVKTEVVKSRRLVITVMLPRDGEFGLRIISRTSVTQSVVCNYLMSTGVVKHERANVKIAKQNLHTSVEALEQEKSHAEWKHLIDTCSQYQENCRKQKVDASDEEMCIADTTIEMYRYKNVLRDCIIRRNIHVIDAVLHLLTKYKNKMAVEEDVKRVEVFKEDLKALRRCSENSSNLKGAFGWLSGNVDPPTEVLKVYRALLLLMVVPAKDLQNWDSMRNNMVDVDSMLKRLASLCRSDIPKLAREKAVPELDDGTAKVLRRDHGEVYALFEWIKSVLNIYSKH